MRILVSKLLSQGHPFMWFGQAVDQGGILLKIKIAMIIIHQVLIVLKIIFGAHVFLGVAQIVHRQFVLFLDFFILIIKITCLSGKRWITRLSVMGLREKFIKLGYAK